MPFVSLRRAAVALILSTPLFAQAPGTGRIVGTVIDAESGKPLADAGVQIVGTTLGVQTGIDGRFRVSNVPAGTVTIQVRRLGYQPKTITGLRLEEGTTTEQSVSLSPNVATVAAMIVSATADKGSVESSLDEQRNASHIVSSVTAEQIARSPDGNAAQAAARSSGITVTDGKYLDVRGSGGRYTTASLNGARMPSPEPERKVVPLDLFPAGLIQSVTTSKSFTPDQSGDFAGGSVDIRTREYPAEHTFTYGSSIGASTGTVGNTRPFVPGVGGEWLALAGSGRNMPADARSAGNMQGVSQAAKNGIINSFRDVWRPVTRSANPNASFRASMGGNDRVFGQRIGYLISGTYSYSQEYRGNEVRNTARPVTPTTQDVRDSFTGSTSGESVLWGALLNAGTLIGANNRLTLNAVYNRTADNDVRTERGFFSADGPAMITRLDYVERSMWSTQLSGEHDRGRRMFEWAASGAGVTRREPDKSEYVQNIVAATATTPEQLLWESSDGEGAVRTFSLLDEWSVEGRASTRWELGAPTNPWAIKFGTLGRGTKRDANTQAFGMFATVLSDTVRALPPEEIFGGRFTAPDSAVINVRSLAQGGSYKAEDGLVAAFSMVEVPLTSTLNLLTGARVEYANTHIRAVSTLGERSPTKRTFTDVLPAAVLTYRPNDVHTLRLSASRTLARPEYRELAGVRSRDVHGGIDLSGNPSLVRTLIDNADFRWELYPSRGELFSVAVFAKRFHDPIERVSRASSAADFVTYVNAKGADNYGLELEARKSLDSFGSLFEPFTAFGSITLMRSRIDLGTQGGASTNSSRAMVGQAPYVYNAGLTYTSRSGSGSATLLYNRIGPRILAAGVLPIPDETERPADMLDFSLRFRVLHGVTGQVNAKNLLGARHEVMQGSIVREGYTKASTIQVGFSVQR
jgi:TonB-dependent receptor